jgi:hypothetical protein
MTRSPVPADPAQAHLAQAHLAWMRYPLDDPRMADMRDEIDRINALGDRSPGCLWRFETAGGTATDVRVLDDPRVLFNLTVWRSVEDLRRYVYRTEHVAFFRRRTSRSCCGGSRRVSVRAWRTPWRGSNGCGARPLRGRVYLQTRVWAGRPATVVIIVVGVVVVTRPDDRTPQRCWPARVAPGERWVPVDCQSDPCGLSSGLPGSRLRRC